MKNNNLYQQILVAIDIEHEPEKVIAKAMNLAQTGTTVNLIHVITPVSDALYASGLSLLPPVIDIEKLQQQSIETAKDKLKDLVSLYSENNIEYDVVLGQPAREIIQAADNHQADLIIIGSHGKHGIQLLLGSTASAVLHHAKCDTLALRL